MMWSSPNIYVGNVNITDVMTFTQIVITYLLIYCWYHWRDDLYITCDCYIRLKGGHPAIVQICHFQHDLLQWLTILTCCREYYSSPSHTLLCYNLSHQCEEIVSSRGFRWWAVRPRVGVSQAWHENRCPFMHRYLFANASVLVSPVEHTAHWTRAHPTHIVNCFATGCTGVTAEDVHRNETSISNHRTHADCTVRISGSQVLTFEWRFAIAG